MNATVLFFIHIRKTPYLITSVAFVSWFVKMEWTVGCILLVLLWETLSWTEASRSRILYSRDTLLKFDLQANSSPPPDLTIPNTADIKWKYGKNGTPTNAPCRGTRKRGRRGGLRERARRSLSRVPLPSIILANMQSLRNKSDELQAHVRYQHEFKEACILALTETWLGEADSDAGIALDGFGVPFRMDRVAATTGKSRGGGVCLYVNERWSKTTLVREKLCTKDIELLSVSMRPFYLPREFPQIFVTIVYIHPKANENAALELIHNTFQKLQAVSPDAPNLILGDFNHCSLDKILKCFYKYVSCETRKGKILDQCYGSIKGAYKSVPLPPLGSADHNCVHLIPVYRTCLQRAKVETRQVKVWSEEATLALQGCLDCTLWEEFVHSSQDIDELTEVVSSWVAYCEETVIPKKVVKIYPNNKPWVSKQLKDLLKKKKSAFKEKNSQELYIVQKEIKREIKRAKWDYKLKVEHKLSQNLLGSAWDSVKSMVGLNDKSKKKVALEGFSSDILLAHELNEFYSRFDNHDFSDEIAGKKQSLLSQPQNNICFSAQSVVNIFKHCKAKKSPGPDNIGSRVLSCCAEQLGLFLITFLINLCCTRRSLTYGNSQLLSLLQKTVIQRLLMITDP